MTQEDFLLLIPKLNIRNDIPADLVIPLDVIRAYDGAETNWQNQRYPSWTPTQMYEMFMTALANGASMSAVDAACMSSCGISFGAFYILYGIWMAIS